MTKPALILSKPYAERRVVVVAPKDEAEVKATTVNWEAVQVAGAFAGAGVAAGAGGVAAVASAAFGWPMLVGYAAYRGIRAAFAPSKPAPIPAGLLAVTHAMATDELTFPPGHPLFDYAYAGHPLEPKRYVPYAAFHRFLFEEKVNELMTLLASLGATRVRVSCTKGFRSAGGVSFGVSKGASGGAGVKTESSHSQEAFFEEEFRPKGEPCVPAGLIWYANEASWQAVAKRRLDFGTSKFRAQLCYEDSFGIDANIKVGLENLGAKLGANYSEFESTEWLFEGEFA